MEMLRFGSIFLLIASTLCVYAADNAPALKDEPIVLADTSTTHLETSAASTQESEATSVVMISTETQSPTSSPTDSSTSHEPTTPSETTTDVPSTTVLPTPPPMDGPGDWKLKDDNGTTCMRLHLAAQFQTVTEAVNLPPNATKDNTTSSCKVSPETQSLTLFWSTDANKTYRVTFVFSLKNATDTSDTRKIYSLTDIHFETHHMNESRDVLASHTGYSYKCNAEDTVKLTDNATAIFKDVQVQAFMEHSDFGTAEQCPADDKSNDIVPIAVGCALAGLVIIVLIAYVIGRKVSRQKGYQSV